MHLILLLVRGGHVLLGSCIPSWSPFWFGSLFSIFCFSDLSVAFGTNKDHTFPKLGCDIVLPEFCLWLTNLLPLICSPTCKLRWKPFLSIISEVIISILKILTKTSVHFLTSCLAILFRLSSHHADSTDLEWNLLSLLSPNYPPEKNISPYSGRTEFCQGFHH